MKMNKKKRTLIAVAAFLLSVVMLFAVSCGIAAESAERLLENAVSRTAKSISEWEIFDIAKEVLTSGSVEAGVNGELAPGNALDLSVKYHAGNDGKTKRNAAVFSLDIGGEKGEMSMFFSEKNVILAGDEKFGAYGFSFEGIREKLANSAFSPKKDNLLDISEEEFENVIDMFEKMNETMKEQNNGETAKKAENLKEKYVTLFFKTFEKEVELSMKKVNDASVLDKTGVKAKVLSCTIDNEDIAAIIDALWNKAKDDEELKSFIGDILENAKLITGTYSVDEIFSEVGKWTEDAKKELNEEKNSITASLFLNPKTGTIMKAELSGKSGKDEASMIPSFELSVELGVELKTFEGLKISATGYDDDGNKTDSDELCVTVSDTDAEYKITVTGTDLIVQENAGGDKKAEGESLILAWNKQTGDLTLTRDNDKIFSGKFTKADGVYTLTCKLGEELDNADLTVVAKTKDTIPDEPAEYRDVLSLSGEELMENIEESVEDSSILSIIMNVITEIGFRTQGQAMPDFDY